MPRTRFALLATVGALLMGVPAAAVPVLFVEGFDRPDGPLGAPWTPIESLLYVDTQVAVAHDDEYGLMRYDDPAGCACDDAVLEIEFSYAGDTDGRIQTFLFGSSGTTPWGFNAKLALDYFAIYELPEAEIETRPLDLDPSRTYRLRLSYENGTTTARLALWELGGGLVDEIVVTEPSGPLSSIAIGIENLHQPHHAKWIDNVRFEYCCDSTSGPEAPTLETWGRVKGVYRD